MDKRERLKEWALSKVGCGYLWGATGYKLTQTKLDQVITSQGASSQAAKYGKKWLGKQCYDCAQLVRWGLRAADVPGVDISGASSQWKKGTWVAKGTISTIPDGVCIIFREDADSNPMGHVGIYMGDGSVIHAQSTKNGVVHTKVADSRWTHWAMPNFDGGEVMPEQPTYDQERRDTLRKGAKGNAVVELQSRLNAHGAKLVVDGIFGDDTLSAVKVFQQEKGLTVDGVVGSNTWTALLAEPDIDPNPEWDDMTVEQRLNNLNERLKRLEGGES